VVGWTYSFLDCGVVIFLALDIVIISVILWMEDRHITRPLPIQYYMEERRQIFMSTVGYEPVMLVSEAQDCAHHTSISVA
jgi:hypothetical protein